MSNTKRIPDKFWLYVMGFFICLLSIFFLFFSLPVAVEPLDFITLFVMLIYLVFVSGCMTLWLVAVHFLWYSDSLFWKILAVVVGGLAAVLVAIVIQFIYENVILERKMS